MVILKVKKMDCANLSEAPFFKCPINCFFFRIDQKLVKTIHDITVSTTHVRNLDGRKTSTRHIESLRKPSLFKLYPF